MNTHWPGPTATGIKYVLILLFLVSLACWAISLSFFVELLTWPLSDPYTIRPSEVTLFFYLTALPLSTTLAALIDLILHHTSHLPPVLTLLWSLLSFAAWIYVLVLWGVCEYSPDVGGDMCPAFYRYDSFDEKRGDVYGYGDGGWRYAARLALGGVAAGLAVCQVGLAGRAVDVRRKEERAGKRKGVGKV